MALELTSVLLDCSLIYRHTVVVGKVFLKELCDEAGIEMPPPEVTVSWAFEYFMSIGKDISNTEGLMEPSTYVLYQRLAVTTGFFLFCCTFRPAAFQALTLVTSFGISTSLSKLPDELFQLTAAILFL